MNGPSGTYVLVGAGLCRIFNVSGSARPAQVPVDLCSNAIVVAAWNTDKRAKENKANHRVYNATGTTQYSWRDSMELACAAWEKNPLDKMLVRSVNTSWVRVLPRSKSPPPLATENRTRGGSCYLLFI